MRAYAAKELFSKYALKESDVFDAKNLGKSKEMLNEMVKSTEIHIKSSIEYLERLPRELQLVWAIPFFMAIPTLLKCYGNDDVFDFDKKVKISRAQTMEIISMIEKNAGKESFPSHYFADLNKKNEFGLALKL